MRHLLRLPIRTFSSAAPNVDKTLLSKLRKQTGVPFINCKKALTKFDNDFDQAKEWLLAEAQREGWTRATKLQARPMSQGLVAILGDSSHATMIEVNCETDFVAKNEKFVAMVTKLVEDCSRYFQGSKEGEIILQKSELGQIPSPEHGTLADILALNIGNLGENMALRRGIYLQAAPGNLLSSYIHPSAGKPKPVMLGRYGAVLELMPSSPISQASEVQSLVDFGRELGQHIVGMNPHTLGEINPARSPSEAESEHGEDQEGGYSSDREDKDDKDESSAFLQQEFLLDTSVTVAELVQDRGVDVVRFSRFACGEELPGENEGQ